MFWIKRHSGFSLIELLVALSILAVVSALIVPKFLGVRANAQQLVLDANLKEYNNAVSMWQALGGQRATNPDSNEAFKLVKFLSTQGSSTDPKRGFNGSDSNTYPTDSMGTGGSYTVSVNATVADGTPSSSSANGYYAKTNLAGTSATKSDINLYVKVDNQVYDLDAQGDQGTGDISSMIFIRTGNAPGVLP